MRQLCEQPSTLPRFPFRLMALQPQTLSPIPTRPSGRGRRRGGRLDRQDQARFEGLRQAVGFARGLVSCLEEFLHRLAPVEHAEVAQDLALAEAPEQHQHVAVGTVRREQLAAVRALQVRAGDAQFEQRAGPGLAVIGIGEKVAAAHHRFAGCRAGGVGGAFERDPQLGAALDADVAFGHRLLRRLRLGQRHLGGDRGAGLVAELKVDLAHRERMRGVVDAPVIEAGMFVGHGKAPPRGFGRFTIAGAGRPVTRAGPSVSRLAAPATSP